MLHCKGVIRCKVELLYEQTVSGPFASAWIESVGIGYLGGRGILGIGVIYLIYVHCVRMSLRLVSIRVPFRSLDNVGTVDSVFKFGSIASPSGREHCLVPFATRHNAHVEILARFPTIGS